MNSATRPIHAGYPEAATGPITWTFVRQPLQDCWNAGYGSASAKLERPHGYPNWGLEVRLEVDGGTGPALTLVEYCVNIYPDPDRAKADAERIMRRMMAWLENEPGFPGYVEARP